MATRSLHARIVPRRADPRRGMNATVKMAPRSCMAPLNVHIAGTTLQGVGGPLGVIPMASIQDIAQEFFVACEAGRGWSGCTEFCKPNATFSAQAEPIMGIETLEQYTDWMKGLLAILPDGKYEVRSFAVDE